MGNKKFSQNLFCLLISRAIVRAGKKGKRVKTLD